MKITDLEQRRPLFTEDAPNAKFSVFKLLTRRF